MPQLHSSIDERFELISWRKLLDQARVRLKLTASDAQTRLEEYKKYLMLRVIYKDAATGHLVPSKPVQAFWMEHMIAPRDYARVCDCIAGELIDHEPLVHDKSVKQRRYEFTLRKYRKEFGHEAPAKIWPRPGGRLPSRPKSRTRSQAPTERGSSSKKPAPARKTPSRKTPKRCEAGLPPKSTSSGKRRPVSTGKKISEMFSRAQESQDVSNTQLEDPAAPEEKSRTILESLQTKSKRKESSTNQRAAFQKYFARPVAKKSTSAGKKATKNGKKSTSEFDRLFETREGNPNGRGRGRSPKRRAKKRRRMTMPPQMAARGPTPSRSRKKRVRSRTPNQRARSRSSARTPGGRSTVRTPGSKKIKKPAKDAPAPPRSKSKRLVSTEERVRRHGKRNARKTPTRLRMASSPPAARAATPEPDAACDTARSTQTPLPTPPGTSDKEFSMPQSQELATQLGSPTKTMTTPLSPLATQLGSPEAKIPAPEIPNQTQRGQQTRKRKRPASPAEPTSEMANILDKMNKKRALEAQMRTRKEKEEEKRAKLEEKLRILSTAKKPKKASGRDELMKLRSATRPARPQPPALKLPAHVAQYPSTQKKPPQKRPNRSSRGLKMRRASIMPVFQPDPEEQKAESTIEKLLRERGEASAKKPAPPKKPEQQDTAPVAEEQKVEEIAATSEEPSTSASPQPELAKPPPGGGATSSRRPASSKRVFDIFVDAEFLDTRISLKVAPNTRIKKMYKNLPKTFQEFRKQKFSLVYDGTPLEPKLSIGKAGIKAGAIITAVYVDEE